VTLYLYTRSLAKLYVTETGSDRVRQLVGEANVVATSVVASAETRTALAGLRRDEARTAAQLTSVKPQCEETGRRI